MSHGDVDETESANSPIYTHNAVDAATWVSSNLGIQEGFGWLTVTSFRGCNSATGANNNEQILI